jgi:hypothetical protein
MNARAWSGLFVALAISLAFTSIAFGQTIRITAPTLNQHLELGYDNGGTPDPNYADDTARDSGTATLTLAVTGAIGTDKIRIKMDSLAPVSITASSTTTYAYGGLAAGAHTVTVELTNASGTPYRGAVAVTRFYLARVCDRDTDCTDGDPCTTGFCFGGAPNTGGFFGSCRFGPATTDPDCCVTSEWCRFKGLSLDQWGLQYQCSDVDGDSVGDCVQCTQQSHCQAVIDNENNFGGGSCKSNPVCDGATKTCTFTPVAGCCTVALQASHCNDSNSCTVDTCNESTRTCVNTPTPGCCVAGNDGLGLGAPDYGCTPAAPDPCLYYTCMGTGTTAVCRSGPKYGQCCDANADCTDASKLNVCTDSDGNGTGVCAGIGANPLYPGAGTCTYPKIDPLCCIKNYECADRYPEYIGTCTNVVGQDWDKCTYAENPEFCETPVTTVVINEVMVNPGGITPGVVVSDFYGEWFEVFNPTDTDVNMDGWTVEDLGGAGGTNKEQFTIDNAGYLVVPAGGFRLFVRSRDVGSNGGLVGGYPWPQSSFALDNDGDEIVLKNAAGVVQDQVAYTAAWPFADGAAMALINPYLDNASPLNWATAQAVYGDPRFGNRGTPRYYNSDVWHEASTAGLTCDDGNPCTVDICNLDKADICSHKVLRDCCTAATAATACNDLNACTIDSCNVATNQCVHAALPSCCVADADCAAWYPTSIVTAAEKADFDKCAYKVCIGNTCRYGRNLSRPACCVSATNVDFGCFDRNVCTVDACVVDGGQDALGVSYDRCTYNLDLNNDSINDCCRLPEDCNDNNPATMDVCDMLDDGQGPGVNRCWYKPDVNYCGPGGSDCNDGNVCTQDICCTGVGAPHGNCPAAHRCVHNQIPNCCTSAQNCVDGLACTTDTCVNGVCQHTEVTAGCCETHADCNGASKPEDKYCRTGYCIGKVCRYGPAIAGCCVTPADCAPTTCTNYTCVNHSCQAQQVANCCLTGADCAPTGEQCTSNVCISNQCTVIDIPNCCEDTNPTGPDPSCNDNNACTADYCMQVGDSGPFQCRRFPVGGAGCCNTVDTCPDDGVHCTATECTTNACKLSPVPNCLATSPYKMTFTEGHSVYAGEYVTVADLSWESIDIGSNPAKAFWTLRPVPGCTPGTPACTPGSLGPDKYLGFWPTATVANFDSCVVLPRFRTTGFANVTLGFDWAANWNSGNVTLRALGRATTTQWNSATSLWNVTISTDKEPEHVNVLLPTALINSDQTQVAFCVAGASTASLTEVLLDQVVLSQGQAPQFAVIANQSATKGQTKTVTDAFTVTELDTDENVTLSFVSSPGTWLRIVNVRKVSPTSWKGDLQISGAVCPAASPYNYSLRVRASDGALEHTQGFVLAISGCP